MTTDSPEARLRRWLEDYRGLLWKIVRAYAATPADAEDLLQDIALALWRSLPSFRGEARPSTWIFRVALHTALSSRRAARRDIPSAAVDDAPDRPGVGERAIHDRVRLGEVLAALREAPPVDRALLIMALEGATLQEMSDVLGITANAAGVKLYRARKRLVARVGG